ncbi:MAG: transporter substrate-binding domain-containing protein [Lactobacillus sp.]
MRKVTKALLVSLLALFMAGCGKPRGNEYQQIVKTKTITWGIKTDTRLFGLLSVKSGKEEGFELDLARAMTKQMLGPTGQAKFVQTTAKTKIPLLLSRSVDVVLATMTITPARQKIVAFTHPYFAAGQSILVKDSSPIKGIKSLNRRGIVVLAVKGTTAVDNMKKFAPKARVQEYDDYVQAFAALKSGQGDAMTTDNGILAGIASENRGYHLAGKTFTDEPYGMALNKHQLDLRNALNKSLAVLKQNGTYRRLVEKWFTGIKGFSVKEAEH